MTTTTVTTRPRFTRRIAAAAALVVAPALAFGLSPAAHAETGTQHFQGCDNGKDDPIWDGVRPPTHSHPLEHSPKHPGGNFDIQWPGNDSTRGWAVHPGVDMTKTQDLLVVPTVRETGIECDNLLRGDAPNYFKHAYESVHFMTGGPDWALGLNSADGRRLNQLHIHLTRLYGPAREDIDRAVKAGKVSNNEHKWVDQVIEVTGHKDDKFIKSEDSKHQYRAWITDSIDANFFKKLNDDIVTPLHKQGKPVGMSHEAMLITRNPAGKGFVVLESDTNSGIHGVPNIEGILDKR
ncbi:MULTISPECIES: CDP-diacylglycerol diphosphatase [unclassified Mycobacterium]|uniref:CDP-diacylglycerol diphosphatase n=1 Tax=unclassified Mycobacterium TaxID=2642494 RepID=UPI00048DAA83|nr:MULTISPECIES: CDP-diacylglycerol diphosphatase [unclassified Mycobacterium]SEB26686.1 CDP-diacylglycerol pyrophosphatase [Mycobacterium sp. 283mftsu]